jgi:hypothetical protein
MFNRGFLPVRNGITIMIASTLINPGARASARFDFGNLGEFRRLFRKRILKRRERRAPFEVYAMASGIKRKKEDNNSGGHS